MTPRGTHTRLPLREARKIKVATNVHVRAQNGQTNDNAKGGRDMLYVCVETGTTDEPNLLVRTWAT